METINAAQFLSALGRTSMQAGVLVLVVLLAQWFFRRRLTPRWRCALWLLVMVRLMLPLSLASSTSIFNWLPAWNGRTTPAAPSSEVVKATPPPVSLETSFGGLVDPPVVTKEMPSAQPVVGIEAAKATVPQVSIGPRAKTPAAVRDFLEHSCRRNLVRWCRGFADSHTGFFRPAGAPIRPFAAR